MRPHQDFHTEVSHRFRHTSLDDTSMTAHISMFHQRDDFPSLPLPPSPTSRGRCQRNEFRLGTLSLLSLRASHALIAVLMKIRCQLQQRCYISPILVRAGTFTTGRDGPLGCHNFLCLSRRRTLGRTRGASGAANLEDRMAGVGGYVERAASIGM